jgi:prepilin-type N-terminal cleavage/methylation domain-containing protein
MGVTRAWGRGFSLIEVAIVLVVAGLVISGGLVALSPLLQSSKTSQTNQLMDRIEQSLVLYVIQNGCLPCPAVPANLTGIAEKNGGGSYTGCTGSCSATYGIVPWNTLGLSKDEVTDPFGSFIDYVPSSSLVSSNSMLRILPATYPTASLSVADASGTSQTSAAAYILISHGPDGSYGYTPSKGTQRPDPNSSTLQSCNQSGQSGCAHGTNYIQADPQTTAAGATSYFDDIVRFRTAPVIIQTCGSNACGNPA